MITAKYLEETEFGLHTDTGIYYNKEENLQGKYTLLVYLNDNYEGGETIFYPGPVLKEVWLWCLRYLIIYTEVQK